MYDMHKRAPVRTKNRASSSPARTSGSRPPTSTRTGGGTFSYWWYPTNVGSPFFEGGSPSPATLDPTNGDVTNAGSASRSPTSTPKGSRSRRPGARRTRPRKPAKRSTPSTCRPKAYKKLYQGSLNTVGQAGTFSPWGTLEQGGNAVEWTDTITAPPFGAKGHRVWRRLHGGVPNAPLYQLWVSAVGLQPQKNTFYTATYPWIGFRIGVIGAIEGSGAK